MKEIKRTVLKKKMSEKKLLTEALFCLSDALTSLYETKTKEGQSLCFMVDSCLKYGTVIFRGDDILEASADYSGYEERRYFKDKKKKVKKWAMI